MTTPTPTLQTLLVDPNEAASLVLEKKLQQFGLGVLRAATMADTLSLARRQPFDLVLTAGLLADGDGVTLTRQLRTVVRESTPIVLVSASPSPLLLDDAFRAGVTDVFTRDDLEHLDNFLRYFLSSLTDTVQGARLLLVEDSAAQQRHLAAILQHRGYVVDTASSVDEARECIAAHEYELYLIDLVLMGAQSGIGLIRQLRRKPEDFVQHPIIVLTGYHDTARKNELYRLGVNDYVVKPPADVELLARVYNLVYMRRLYQQLRDRERLLQAMALTDPVTQIANRHTYDQLGPRHLQRARRDGKPIALLVVDIDHFKRVNDRFGHAFGDTVLAAVAQALATGVRAHDLVARYGGEEFVILLADCPQEVALRKADALRERVARSVRTPDGPVTISVGVAVIPPDSQETLEQAFTRADAALYEAKAAGRDTVRLAPASRQPS
ncbi:diguanylate cyclase [Tepidimonas sp. HKU79]|uniref:diguanylate cyclase n=1 Tax=unclassified Tepidimonas TaxID=2631705 RepID=UPI003C7D4363